MYSSANGVDHLHPLCIHGARSLQYALTIKKIEAHEFEVLQKSMHSIVFDERGINQSEIIFCPTPVCIIFGSEQQIPLGKMPNNVFAYQ
jgi:hypothetical protein